MPVPDIACPTRTATSLSDWVMGFQSSAVVIGFRPNMIENSIADKTINCQKGDTFFSNHPIKRWAKQKNLLGRIPTIIIYKKLIGSTVPEEPKI